MNVPPPILDPVLADEFFVVQNSDDAAQLREMMDGFVADVGPRLVELYGYGESGPESAETVRRALHQLRGVVANFACSAAAAQFRELERDWPALDGVTKKNRLQAAEADLQAGIKALRERYPFLA